MLIWLMVLIAQSGHLRRLCSIDVFAIYKHVKCLD